MIVRVLLSINRPDLTKKGREGTKKWTNDGFLFQLVESTINLVTGKERYSNSNSFYIEQLANLSVFDETAHRARGVTRPLCGEVSEAKLGLEEAISQGGTGDEIVAATPGPSSKGEVGGRWRCPFEILSSSSDG